MDDELSPSAAARRIGTSTRSVQRWIAEGRLPARRVGGQWRVAIGAIDALAPNPAQPLAAHPIRSVFVANRGEIAERIRRTTDRLAIRAVVPPTDGPGAVDLLSVESVVAAARAADADAIHPGFGFLAESPELADAVARAGLRWIGPPAAAIRAMGDKAAARRLRQRRPVRRGARFGGGSDRPPADRQAGGGRRRQGHARRPGRR